MAPAAADAGTGGARLRAWDLAGIAAQQWSYDPAQTIGVLLPGRLPVEELLFFIVVPVCAVLGYEAVRKVLKR